MKLALLALVVLFFGGCSKNYTMEELAGRYAIGLDAATDFIELKSNGTYVHSYRTNEGFEDSQNGTWDLETLDAGRTVVLNHFRPILGEKFGGEGFYLLEVRSFFGNVRLITNIDLNEGYVKQS